MCVNEKVHGVGGEFETYSADELVVRVALLKAQDYRDYVQRQSEGESEFVNPNTFFNTDLTVLFFQNRNIPIRNSVCFGSRFGLQRQKISRDCST